MEYVVVIFVGLWVCAAGILAYRQVSKDFKEVDVNKEEMEDAE